MIQFNLLPDVKLEFVKARRLKRLIIIASIAASGLALFILILFILNVDVVQKKSQSDLNKDITASTNTLKSVKNLDKILTVQNQLNTLGGLHDGKLVASRTFGFLSQVTPKDVTISALNVDFTALTMTITGNAPALNNVNQLVDTLKATTYKSSVTQPNTAVATTTANAFSNVVLTSFATDSKGATYTLDFKFDTKIYANTADVIINVPSDTVSNTSVLFKKAGN